MDNWRIDQNQDAVELRILDNEKLIVEITNIEPHQANELASQLKDAAKRAGVFSITSSQEMN